MLILMYCMYCVYIRVYIYAAYNSRFVEKMDTQIEPFNGFTEFTEGD